MLFVCLYSLALFGGRKNKIIENQRFDLKKIKYQLNSQNAAPMALVKLRLAVWKRLRSHQLQCLRNVLRPQTFCKQLLWYQNIVDSSRNRESKIMIVTIKTYQFKLRWEVSGESVSKRKITILMMKTLMMTTTMVLMILAIMKMTTTTMMMMEGQFQIEMRSEVVGTLQRGDDVDDDGDDDDNDDGRPVPNRDEKWGSCDSPQGR